MVCSVSWHFEEKIRIFSFIERKVKVQVVTLVGLHMKLVRICYWWS